ncbi:transposase [Nonomuraea guangzhouensis]|uniref:transposase n=1 Tax=Nonomuraea guangzhouensis TaxID=1291555 RepID=UPI001C5DB54D|nr:transposase [Nonomuraea guangzhouensis]
MDSQTVRAAETVGAAACGYDAGKKLKGQKRYVVVDTLGLLLCVIVTAASVQDRDGAYPVLALLREKFSTITLVWADGGYTGRLVTWAGKVLGLAVTIVRRSDDLRGFVVLPRRWVVERTFAWLVRYRRLVRRFTQLPRVLALMSNSRATDATVRSPSSTMRMASSLNSGENCLRRLVTYLPLPDCDAQKKWQHDAELWQRASFKAHLNWAYMPISAERLSAQLLTLFCVI